VNDTTQGTARPPELIPLPAGLVLRRRSLVPDQAFNDALTADLDHLRVWLAWAQEAPTLAETAMHRAAQDESWEAGQAYGYLVTPAEGAPRVLGGCAMFGGDGPGVLEIGYWLRSEQVGRGIAAQAAAALSAIGLGLPGTKRMEIHCDQANVRSSAVPRRLGYRLDRIEPDEPVTAAEVGRSMVWVLDDATRLRSGRELG
jgi:RimJ/RimL family protein N-acetyltransferase